MEEGRVSRASKKMKEGEDNGSGVRKWEDLDQDLLRKIFSKIGQGELLLNVSSVCLPWNSAVCDLLFKREPGTLNLTPVQRVNFRAFEYHLQPKVLMSILVKVMKSYSFDGDDGFGSITKMVFPSHPSVLDRHLVYLAQRSNKLKRLYLAAPQELTGKGFSRAIRNWRGIEEMLMGPLDQVHLEHIIKEIGINCKHLEVLYLDHFWLNGFSAPVIAENLRGLKVVKFHEVFYSDSGLQVLLSKCSKLWELELINCARFVKCGEKLGALHPSYINTVKIKRIQVCNSVKWSVDGEQEIYTPKEMVCSPSYHHVLTGSHLRVPQSDRRFGFLRFQYQSRRIMGGDKEIKRLLEKNRGQITLEKEKISCKQRKAAANATVTTSRDDGGKAKAAMGVSQLLNLPRELVCYNFTAWFCHTCFIGLLILGP